MMRRSLLLGILLMAIGAVIVLHGLSEGTERSVFRIGNVQTSVEARRSKKSKAEKAQDRKKRI